MNGALRIQILADARQARTQLNQIRGQLSAIKRVVDGFAATSKKLAASSTQVAAAHAKAAKAAAQVAEAEARVAIATAKTEKAQSQAAAAAQRLAQAQNSNLASAERLTTAQAAATQATLRLTEAQVSQMTTVRAGVAGNRQFAANLGLVAQATDAVSSALLKEQAAEQAGIANKHTMAAASERLAAATHNAAAASAQAAAASARYAASLEPEAAAAHQAAAAQHQLEAAYHRSQAAEAMSRGGIHAAAASQAGLRANALQAASSFEDLSTKVASSGSSWQQATRGLQDYSAHLLKAGKDTQWLGRIFVQNVTLPLALVGGLSVKWALDFETAMTRIRKVYGDLSTSEQTVNHDMELLARGFRALSDIFGVHVEDVANIAAVWAQAGATGEQLARVTRASVEAMLLGDLDVDQATAGLITIMGAYKLTSRELTDVLALLNVVENETAVSFGDLLTVLEKSGGVAHNAGVTIQELASMTASLVPVSGDAAEAGNALKSIMQRVMAPTKEAAAAFKSFGIDVNSASWASKTFMERIGQVVDKWSTLDQNTKLNFARDVFGLFQANRGITLLDDLSNAQGRYRKSIDATSDSTNNLKIYQKELATLLASSPQAFKILTNRTRNLVIELGLQLIPYVNLALAAIVKLITKFSELDPVIKKIIFAFVVLAGTIGPLLMLKGLLRMALGSLLQPITLLMKGFKLLGASSIIVQLSWILLIGLAAGLGYALGGLEGAIWGAAAAMLVLALLTGGWPALIIAAIAIIAALTYTIYKHWDGIKGFMASVMNSVVSNMRESLMLLPRLWAAAFEAVVRVIAAAAKAVYSWLSYLNPFARHSPSLVEQVQDGTAVIADEYSNMADSVVASLDRVKAGVARLTAQMANARAQAAAATMTENIRLAGLAGIDAGTIIELTDAIADMKGELDGVKAQVDAQSAVVDMWKERLEAANDAVDAATDRLRELQDVVSALDDELAASQDRLQNWLSTPVTGTYAFEDAIFSNDQAQKALQLQIAQLEKRFLAAGTTVDEVRRQMEDLAEANGAVGDSLLTSGLSADEARQKMAELQAEIDTLRGEQLDLRLQGAGSDVLQGIDAQIAQADAIRKQLAQSVGDGGASQVPQDLRDMVAEIDRLQKELDSLQLDGEILNLEEALALEPARKSIRDTQRVFEQSLDVILAGIASETAAQASLTAQREAAAKAVEDQQKIVDDLTASRDAISDAYDRESKQLEILEKNYRSLEDAMNDAQKVLDEALALGKEIDQALKDAAAAGGVTPGDFELPEGGGGLGPEDGWLDGLIADWEKEGKEAIDRMFDELFGRVGKKWDNFRSMLSGGWDLMKSDIVSKMTSIGGTIWQKVQDWRDRLDSGFAMMRSDFEAGLTNWGGRLSSLWSTVWGFLGIDDIWSEFESGTLSKIGGLPGKIAEKLSGLPGTFADIWGRANTTVLDLEDGMWRNLGDIFTNGKQSVEQILQGLVISGNGIVLSFVGLITGNFNMLLQGVTMITQGIQTTVVGIFQALVGTIQVNLSNGFRQAWGLVSQAWNQLGLPSFQTMLGWLQGSFLPQFAAIPNMIVSAFSTLGARIGGVFGSLRGQLSGGLNSAIGVVNRFIGGINSVASTLGIGFRIGTIPMLEAGGQIPAYATGGSLPSSEVGSGFVTNGARAIVGEGSKIHPEYVIPTDPKYRDRAVALAEQLMGSLGMARGGRVPAYEGGGVLGFITSTANKVATRIWDNAVSTAYANMGQVGGLGGQFGWGVLNKLVVQVGNNIINKWLAQWWNDQKNSVLNLVGLGSGLAKSASTISKKSTGNNAMPLAMGGTIPHIYSLMNGALVKGGRGGILAHIGDGSRDELVQPLDRSTRGAGSTVIINGDVVIPGITNGNEAEKFIKNLEALAA